MNRNLEEQKISQWFHEARQQDAARAPAFAETLAAARSKKQPATWRWLAWRVAFVMVALIAIGVAALIFFKQSSAQPANRAAFEPGSEPLPDYLYEPPALAANLAAPAVVPGGTTTAPHARLSHRRPQVAQPQFA